LNELENNYYKSWTFRISIALIFIYMGMSYFCNYFTQHIFKRGFGVPIFLFGILIINWFFRFKKTFWAELSQDDTGFTEDEFENYKKSTNCLFGTFLVLNSIIWFFLTYCTNNFEEKLVDFFVLEFFLSSVLFVVLIAIFIPQQRAILKYDNKGINKNFYLNVWNCYVYKDKGIKNIDLFFSNASSITNNELNLVKEGLSNEEIDQLENFKLYSELPRYRDSVELSFTTIVKKIVKVTGSITLFGLLYKLGSLIFTEINKENRESNNIIRLLLNYGSTIASLVILILLFWFVISLVFYELSSAQKRKQIDYIFPKLVEETLEKKRKN